MKVVLDLTPTQQEQFDFLLKEDKAVRVATIELDLEKNLEENSFKLVLEEQPEEKVKGSVGGA